MISRVLLVLTFFIITVCPEFAAAQSLPPLRAGAAIAKEGGPATVSVKAKGASGAWFFAPWPVEYIVDVAVQGGGEVMVTLVTEDQYKSLSAGRQPANGQPPLKEILNGRDSASVSLPRGNYFLAFNNRGTVAMTLTYRASFIRK